MAFATTVQSLQCPRKQNVNRNCQIGIYVQIPEAGGVPQCPIVGNANDVIILFIYASSVKVGFRVSVSFIFAHGRPCAIFGYTHTQQ